MKKQTFVHAVKSTAGFRMKTKVLIPVMECPECKGENTIFDVPVVEGNARCPECSRWNMVWDWKRVDA